VRTLLNLGTRRAEHKFSEPVLIREYVLELLVVPLFCGLVLFVGLERNEVTATTVCSAHRMWGAVRS
jgi:hypothetical protein